MAKTFKEWYEQNKARVSAERKLKYDQDPAYRTRVKALSQESKARHRAANPPTPLPGVSVEDTCSILGVTEWTLSSWRERQYYPPPSRMGGRIFFTKPQVELLGLIRQFFQAYPRRVAGLHRAELNSLVEVIFHNWSS